MRGWGMVSRCAVTAAIMIAGMAVAAPASAMTTAPAEHTSVAQGKDDPGEDSPGKSKAAKDKSAKAKAAKGSKAGKGENGRGNSAEAKRCKKGGWEALAPSDDPASPFVNQGKCVRYVVKGGTLVEAAP